MGATQRIRWVAGPTPCAAVARERRNRPGEASVCAPWRTCRGDRPLCSRARRAAPSAQSGDRILHRGASRSRAMTAEFRPEPGQKSARGRPRNPGSVRSIAASMDGRGFSRSNVWRLKTWEAMQRRYPWLDRMRWPVEPTLRLRALLRRLPEAERDVAANVISDTTASEGLDWLASLRTAADRCPPDRDRIRHSRGGGDEARGAACRRLTARPPPPPVGPRAIPQLCEATHGSRLPASWRTLYELSRWWCSAPRRRRGVVWQKGTSQRPRGRVPPRRRPRPVTGGRISAPAAAAGGGAERWLRA
jgi:hypothetical protein